MSMIGQQVGSYRILRILGQGGMGVVYLAVHPLLGKKAAVKMLLPALSANRDLLQRFFNEAKATTLLNHPGVVQVFDFGHHPSGCAYITMELLEGEGLDERLRREPTLPLGLTLEIGRQVASALAAAHGQGIIHRDLKPGNVCLVPAPDLGSGVRAKVLDFGIAKLTGASATSDAALTRTDAIMGTPSYMSPEQCRGAGQVDQRADIYALGCLMVRMATGRPLFTGPGPGEVLAMQIYSPPPSFAALLGPEVDAVLQRTLVKDREARYGSMNELVAALDGLLARQPPRGPYSVQCRPLEVVEATPPPPNTITGAASEIEALGRVAGRRSWWRSRGGFAAAAAVVVLGGGLGTALLVRGGRSAGPPPTLPGAAVAPSPAAPPAPAPPAVTPPKAPPASISIALDSAPQGAAIYEGTIRLGTTPMIWATPRSPQPAALIWRLPGYLDFSKSVERDRDGELQVVLQPLAAPTSPAPSPPRAKGKGGPGLPRADGPPKSSPGPEAVKVPGVIDPFAN